MATSNRAKHKNWETHVFGQDLPPLEPFDLEPVSDIPIRQAVEEGALKQNKELAIYKTTQEWNGFPARTTLIAGLIEEGKPYAVWVGRKGSVSDAQNQDDAAEDESAPSEDRPPEEENETNPIAADDDENRTTEHPQPAEEKEPQP